MERLVKEIHVDRLVKKSRKKDDGRRIVYFSRSKRKESSDG